MRRTVAELCQYCLESRIDDAYACFGSKPFEHHGAEACTGFEPTNGARCCECGAATEDMGLVLDGYLMCFDCLELIFEVDDGLYEAYDPAQAELTDLIVELGGEG